MTIQDKIIKIISFVVITNILVIVGYLSLAGYPKNVWELIRYNAILTLLATGLFYLINHFLWHLPLINKLFGSIPNINGTWNGEIINSKDGIKQPATLNIIQTWLGVDVNIKTERANSSTVASEIVKIGGMWKLYFTWEGRGDHASFEGTTIVNIDEDNLDGHYFSNSNIDGKNCTSGSFKATKIKTINEQ